jgi:hypothetical protein
LYLALVACGDSSADAPGASADVAETESDAPDGGDDTATEADSATASDADGDADDSAEGSADPLAWLTSAPAEDAAPKLLFIGIDGVRADAFEAADTPTFDLLRANGTWTNTGSTQLSTQTDSSAGWTALLTGVDSTLSGVTDNDSLSARDWSHPTFSKVLKDAVDAEIVVAAHWIPFAGSIHEPGLFDALSVGLDNVVASDMATRLTGELGDVFLAHFDDCDHAGHDTGFSVDNPAYMDAIETADAHAGQLIAAISARTTIADENWLVLVVTDHGGIGTSHGDMVPECQTIPFVFAGPSRVRGEFAETVSQLDVAPTVIAHFGASESAPASLQGIAR